MADSVNFIYFHAVISQRSHTLNTPSEKDIRQALEAFRAASGLEICIKFFHRQLGADSTLAAAAGPYSLHTSAFCRSVKRTRNDRCRTCDLRAVPARGEALRRPFFHTCHAGADELIIPLILADTLVGVAYVGQFRAKAGQPAELPLLKPAERRRLAGLGQLLDAYLTRLLRTTRETSLTADTARARAIRAFLETRLRDNPDLTALARELGLSVSRTAHVVKTATGKSFVELRDELRLRRACDLLAGTHYKVAHVAAECGFASPEYFHRFFRRATGSTPLTHRRENRPDA